MFALVLIIALKFIPVDTLTGDKTDQYVSEELANQSVLDLILGIDSYTVDDLPVVVTMIEELKNTEVMDGKKVKDFIDINTDVIKGAKITELGNVFEKAIKVTATIDNTVGAELLGDFGKLETLTTFKAVEKNIDKTAQDFNAKLYYYDNNGKFERAFTDDKQYVRGVNENTALYYAAITQVPITEAIDLIDETFSRIEIVELLNLAGAGSPEGETNMIETIFAGKTIGELGSFGPENILLFDVLGGDETNDIYKILEKATGVAYNQITLADLTDKLDINNVTISTFLGEEGGDIGEVLSSALSGKAYKEITLGDLSSEDFNVNNVTLSTFDLGEDILKILCAAVKVPAGQTQPTTATLNLGHLVNGFSIDNVSLSEFIPENITQGENESDEDFNNRKESTKQLYSMLRAITGKQEGEDVVIGDIKGKLETKNIKISTVMTDIKATDLLAQILVMATPASSWETATLGDLTSFNPNGITLSTVMTDIKDTDMLAKILVMATPASSWETATVGDLTSFNPNEITLSTVLKEEDAGELANILNDIFDAGYNSITIGHLDGLEIGEVHLSTVLKGINATLKGILEDEYVGHVEGVNSYEDITLNHLNSFNIDYLHLNKVLPADTIDVNLKNILMEITGKTDYDTVYVEDLHNETDILSKIKLQTVLGDATISNPILAKLVSDNVSVKSIGQAIDNLKLSDVYGTDVFKAKSSSAPANALWFKLEADGKTYTMVSSSANATHYLNNTSGIWLLICYNASTTYDATGRPVSYIVAEDKTISSLNSGTGITNAFINATIRQLVDAGIVAESDVHEKIMKHTLVDVLKNPESILAGA